MGIVQTTMQYQKCIDLCNRCAQVCHECMTLCLNEPDVAARKKCISMLVECADLCMHASSLMAMNGQYAKDLCGLCATACDQCAKECQMFRDDHCAKCANECKTCANECRAMMKS